LTDAARTIAAFFRIELPKLVARLARVVRDVAEELAQDAMVIALERWPAEGVPDNPGAWARERRLPKDRKLAALSGLSRALIEKRGHVDERDLAAFAEAGFAKDQVLEVIAGLAVSTMANYAGNITKPALEEPFKLQAWNS